MAFRAQTKNVVRMMSGRGPLPTIEVAGVYILALSIRKFPAAFWVLTGPIRSLTNELREHAVKRRALDAHLQITQVKTRLGVVLVEPHHDISEIDISVMLIIRNEMAGENRLIHRATEQDARAKR